MAGEAKSMIWLCLTLFQTINVIANLSSPARARTSEMHQRMYGLYHDGEVDTKSLRRCGVFEDLSGTTPITQGLAVER